MISENGISDGNMTSNTLVEPAVRKNAERSSKMLLAVQSFVL
jgi:hypothetical protein